MPVQSPQVRPVRTSDLSELSEVAEIYAHFVLESVATFDETPPTLDFWQSRAQDLAVRGLPFLVLEVEDVIAGFAYAAPYRTKPAYRKTVEDTIYLSPDWVGKGLGRQLLEPLLAACEAAEMREVIAVIAETDDAASVRLHQRCGFQEVGRLESVGYKLGRWVDTIVLQRHLGRSPLS